MNNIDRMREAEKLLTQEDLKQQLEYFPNSGLFLRISGQNIGDIAGTINHGYVAINLKIQGKNRLFKAHRLATLYEKGSFPANFTDHKNLIRSDNRWCNLQDLTSAENMRNSSIQSNNSSGYTGVCPGKRGFYAHTRVNGKRHYSKTFPTKAEAVAARAKMDQEHGFSSLHGTAKPRQAKTMTNCIQQSLERSGGAAAELKKMIAAGYNPEARKNRVKGVCFHKQSGKYRATISTNGQRKHIGYFKKEHSAILARYSYELLLGTSIGSTAEDYRIQYFNRIKSETVPDRKMNRKRFAPLAA